MPGVNSPRFAATLGCIDRADGSCICSLGPTALLASVLGPGDCKVSRQMSEGATVDILYKSISASTSCQADYLTSSAEQLLRQMCDNVLLTRNYPRSLIALTVQELHNDGSFLATAVNACYLALLDAGLALAGAVAAVTCHVGNDSISCDGLTVDSSADMLSRLSDTKMAVTIMFSKRKGNIMVIGCESTGTISAENMKKCITLGTSAAERYFDFYLALMRKKYSRSGVPQLSHAV